MRSLLASAAFVLAAAPALADPITVPSGTYTLDPTHTSVVWKVSHLGMSNYTARFDGISGSLDLNAEDPTASVVSVVIDPASISTGYPLAAEKDFDAKLAQDEKWFNAGAFPEISFTSNSLEMTGETTGTMTGDLTLLGVTQPVTFDVTLNGQFPTHPFAPDTAALGFSARTVIDRTDFGFTELVPGIGAEVEVLVETEFTKPLSEES